MGAGRGARPQPRISPSRSNHRNGTQGI
jgi:hypothetical protein